MTASPRDENPFDPGLLARRLLRAAPWALGMALLAAGAAALVEARVPPTYQASLALRLWPVPQGLPADVVWPGTPGTAQVLLLGGATREEVAKDADVRAAFGVSGDPGWESRFSATYGQRVSVFPGSGEQALWVVARDPDPERARRLAHRIVEVGLTLFRARLSTTRERLESSWSRIREAHLSEIRRIDAELARPERTASGRRETQPPAETEALLARRRVRVEALEQIERESLALDAALEADARPWTILEPAGAFGDLVPRERLRSLAAPALFAAALTVLVRLLRDGHPSGE